MLILIHVLIALAGLLATTGAYLKPSRKRLSISFAFIGATLLSGSYLVVSTHAGLVSSCLTGLIYLAVNLCGISLAYRKLIAAEEEIRS